MEVILQDVPYPSKTNVDVALRVVEGQLDDEYLEIKETHPKLLVNVVKKCTLFESEARPKFVEIVEMLESNSN